MTWTRVKAQPAFANLQSLVGIAPSFPNGIVLAGNAGCHGALWRSDGSVRRWRRIDTGHTFDGALIRDLEERFGETRDTAITVGVEPRSVSSDGSHRRLRAVSWRSVDGIVWRRSPEDAALSGTEFSTLFVTRAGYLAIGGVTDGPARNDCALRCVGGAGIWRSSDGLHWRNVLRNPAQDVSIEGISELDVDGQPMVMAVGGNERGGVVWTSPDGDHWTETSPAVFEGARLTALVRGLDDNFMAVGVRMSGRQGPTVWLSADGQSWEPAEGPVPTGIALLGALPFRGYFCYDPAADGSGGIWGSVDGAHWDRFTTSPTPTALVRWRGYSDGGFMAMGQKLGDGVPLWLTGYATG